MKIVLILFAILIVGYSKDVPKRNLKFNSYAVIRQLFEMIKYNIKNGHFEKDLPALDPFQFINKTIEMLLPHNALSLHADFKNGVFKGLANFQLEEVDFVRDEIAMDLLIRFPSLTFTSGSMEIRNYIFGGRVYLMQSKDEKSVLIRNISHPQFNIEQIVSRLDFDKNIDNIINAIIDDLLANYFTRFNQYVSHICADDVMDLVNYFLNKLDTWTIFAVLLW
ncbi:unnamed protein product, partial [Brenthis ino]